MRVCVFVDGENLRLAINDLYSAQFDKNEYLPKNANWSVLYDDITFKAFNQVDPRQKGIRLRTYWYVVQGVNSYPRFLKLTERSEEEIKEWENRNRTILKNFYGGDFFNRPDRERIDQLRRLQDDLYREDRKIRSRFHGFTTVQNGISRRHQAVEFRRSGDISYNLLDHKFGKEKTVDVNLAVDMVTLVDNYDLAIIVSGDQDFVPAAQAVKNMGKQVVNVAFRARNGTLLPGGARQLNQTADWSVELDWDAFRKVLGISSETNDHLRV